MVYGGVTELGLEYIVRFTLSEVYRMLRIGLGLEG